MGKRRKNRPLPWEGRLHSLKHMNILFQPMFSEAWLAEKFFGSIDTSITLVEQGLWEVRRTLPFVRQPRIVEKKEFAQTPEWTRSHANFSLTLSQLHNKAGDLYFFKGRQPVTPSEIKAMAASSLDLSSDRPTDGYLLRAHYNYAVSLHDLRRYILYRVMRSKDLSMAEKKTPTLIAKALPDFIFRAAAGSISDMAEATLARISLFSLFSLLKNKKGKVDSQRSRFQRCLEWLETEGTEKPRLVNRI